MKSFIKALLLFGLFLGQTAFAAGPFYVSTTKGSLNNGSFEHPFRTIQQAKMAARPPSGTLMTEDTIVYLLADGVHYLGATQAFWAADSGNNGHYVVYKAYGSEEPVISGGFKFSSGGWTETTTGSGIYRKTVTYPTRFRQLYVDGRRAVRARHPNIGSIMPRLVSWDVANKKITVESSDIALLGTPVSGQSEIVIARGWSQNRLLIGSLAQAGSSAVLSFTGLADFAFNSGDADTRNPGQSYILENALSLLDGEDEWYLDEANDLLYYKPRAGDSINSSEFVAPNIQKIFDLIGESVDAPVSNLKFEGLTFAHTSWTAPSAEGYVGRQAGYVAGGSVMTHAVYLRQAQNIQFKNNAFTHMGSHALTFDGRVWDCVVEGNRITDISGNGINLAIADAPSPADPRDTPSRNIVRKNIISDCGSDYWGCVGIFASYVNNTQILYNEVSYLPYTGISVGWGNVTAENAAHDNIIMYNHVHHVCEVLEDGGGIYTKANQPGTVIASNYIHNIRRSPSGQYLPSGNQEPRPIAAVYLDNASNNMLVQDNVCLNVEKRVHLNNTQSAPAGSNNTILNNEGINTLRLEDNQGLTMPYRAGPPLVGYWKMEETGLSVTDFSGAGNTGTNYSGAVAQGITSSDLLPGIAGNARRFYGSNYIRIGSSSSLTEIQRFTFAAWIKPDKALSAMNSSYPEIVSKQDWAGNAGFLLASMVSKGTAMGCRFLSGATTAGRRDVSYTEASSGGWIHLAGAYDGAYLRIYRNGLLESAVAAVGLTINHNATPLLIGRGFEGLIDEVRLYGEALEIRDIETLYQMRIDTSLIARWPMDDLGAFSLSDVSGRAHMAAVSGNATWQTDAHGVTSLTFAASGGPAVSIKSSTALELQRFTLSAWAMPAVSFANMLNPYPSLVSKHSWENNTGYYLGGLGADSNVLGVRFLCGASVAARKERTYVEAGYGQWIHVAATYDGDWLRVYRNGVLTSSAQVGLNVINHDATAVILGAGFEGQLRDVRLYNRALSESEIKLLNK